MWMVMPFLNESVFEARMVIPNLPTVVRCPPLVVPPTLNSLGSQRRLEHGCPNHETVTVSGVEVAVECVEESCGNWEAVVWCSRVGSLDTSHQPLQLQAVLQRVGKPVFNVEVPDGIQGDFDEGWLDSGGEVCDGQHEGFL